MEIKKLFPLGLILIGLTGCSSVATRIPTVQVIDRTALSGIEYSLVSSVSGQACRHYYGLWPIPIFWWTGSGEDAAAVDALSHEDGADLLIKTIVTEDTHSVGIWYSRKCITVKGKAVKMKLDSEQPTPTLKTQVVSTQDKAADLTDKKVFLRDNSIIVGTSIEIESGNINVKSAHGILTIPINDVLRIE